MKINTLYYYFMKCRLFEPQGLVQPVKSVPRHTGSHRV